MQQIDSGDAALVQIVDRALAEATERSGAWLACRIGCTECCMGSFPITQLDAYRLQRGLHALETADPERAAQVLQRARAFSDGEDEPCPALDPATGACDLYTSRPLTCRTFGPAIRCGGDDIGVCELCFQGATEAEILACQVQIDTAPMEAALLESLPGGDTTVAAALTE